MDDIFDENTDDLDIARLDNTIHKKNIYKVSCNYIIDIGRVYEWIRTN